jgi:hypothetical protein
MQVKSYLTMESTVTFPAEREKLRNPPSRVAVSAQRSCVTYNEKRQSNISFRYSSLSMCFKYA